MTTEMLNVSIWRGQEDGAFAEFQVPRQENQTVLDVVTHIQRHMDPSLSYRFACRVGVCGSCAMTVNGKARWTCRSHVSNVVEDGRIEIRPLEELQVVKDLVVDMSRFFDKWAKAKGSFVPTSSRDDELSPVSPGDRMRKYADAGIECIGCGACYATCDVVKWKPDYLGPAALNRAWTLVNDVRDGGNDERIAAIAGDDGCLGCHSQQGCVERCPQKLNPTMAIAGLKRAAVKAMIRGKL